MVSQSPQVTKKYGWTEPAVWALALEGKDDLPRFNALNRGLLTWAGRKHLKVLFG